MKPVNIVTFSGGKDSQATVIWANNNLKEEYQIVFCDTAWESAITYQFMLEFEAGIQQEITHLKSSKYKGFIDMVKTKKRFPATKSKFCTEELKVKPMIDFILDKVKSNCNIYQGIRWEESTNRAEMNKIDDYFKNYYTPILKTNPKTGKTTKRTYSYRKKEVLEFLKKHEATVIRPIISWTGIETIAYITENGFQYNPLYDFGFHRVGCFPCIMCNHSEILLIIKEFPERIDEISDYEKKIGSTFFPMGYIPQRYCSKEVGASEKAPTIHDVVRYISDRRMKQTNLFGESTCKNIYIPCE